MKIPTLVVTASLAIVSVGANAAPTKTKPIQIAPKAKTNECGKIAENINTTASAITKNANAYWKHRAKFVDLKFGRLQQTVPDALAVAEQQETQGNALRASLPNSVASFKNLVATAKVQNCLLPRPLEATIEATFKLAKGVNFDRFPEEELPAEASVDSGAPRMPLK